MPGSSCFCMQDPVHVDEDINTCPSLRKLSTRRAAALAKGFWISFSKYTLPNSREEHGLAPPKGKHRCLAPNPWNFLNFCGQKGKGQRLGSTIYFDSFSANCSQPHTDRAFQDPRGLPARHGKFQSYLQADGGYSSPTEVKWIHQPSACWGRIWSRPPFQQTDCPIPKAPVLGSVGKRTQASGGVSPARKLGTPQRHPREDVQKISSFQTGSQEREGKRRHLLDFKYSFFHAPRLQFT